jgi:hypothetical protein
MGTMIDELEGLREKRRVLKAAFDDKDAPLKEQYEEIEKAVIGRMLEEKSEGNKGKKASGNIQRAMTFSVASRPELEAWAKKTGNMQVFTNHLSSASINELLAMNTKLRTTGIPGTKSFEKITLRLSSLG